VSRAAPGRLWSNLDREVKISAAIFRLPWEVTMGRMKCLKRVHRTASSCVRSIGNDGVTTPFLLPIAINMAG